MTDLIVRENNLPASLEDLSAFVLFNDERVKSVRAALSAMHKLKAPREVLDLKLREAQELSEQVALAKMELGKRISEIPKADNGGANQYQAQSTAVSTKQKPKSETIAELGLTQKQAERLQQMAKNPDAVHSAMAKARENDDVVSESQILKEIKAQKKEQEIEQAKADITAQKVDDTQKPTLFIGNGINFTPDEPYKLLLTDPPYSTDVDDVQAFAESWLPNALMHVRRDGFAYVFIGAYPDELRAYLNIPPPKQLTLTQILVWTYRNTLGNNPKDRYKQNWQACLFYRGLDAPPLDCPLTNEQWAVQDINAPDGRLGNRYHSWQKPDEIAERFIRHSTQKGDIVFDPFACTGTFLLAAAKLGRIAYGFEINPDNAQIAFERGCTNGRTL